jgi:hypothetical protein
LERESRLVAATLAAAAAFCRDIDLTVAEENSINSKSKQHARTQKPKLKQNIQNSIND